MINIIGAIMSGVIVGLLAQFVYAGSEPMGWTATFGLGVAGSMVANLLASHGRSDFQRGGCLASIFGAVAFILIARFIGWR